MAMINAFGVKVARGMFCTIRRPRGDQWSGTVTAIRREGLATMVHINNSFSGTLDDVLTAWKCPTPADIAYALASDTTRDHKFFSRNNMKFAGDTMRNFGTFADDTGRIILYRRKPVKHGLTGRWVYDPERKTLRTVINSDYP